MPAFDTHQRLALVKRLLERLIPEGRTDPARVLDLGGFPGLLAGELGPGYRTITVDRQEGALADYVRASGCALPFADGAFDAVVASDVLEHVEPANRPALLSESARVSRGWLLVGGPFHSPETAAAEAAVRSLTRSVQGAPNRWLEEHAQNGLPGLDETRAILGDLGFAAAAVPNGCLFSWFLLKELELLFHALPDALEISEGIDAHYADQWSELDHQTPTYRHLLLAHRDRRETAMLIASPPAGLQVEFLGPEAEIPPAATGEVERIQATAGRFAKLAETIGNGHAAAGVGVEPRYVDRLEHIVETQEQSRTRLEADLEELRARLARYDSSRVVRLWAKLRGG